MQNGVVGCYLDAHKDRAVEFERLAGFHRYATHTKSHASYDILNTCMEGEADKAYCIHKQVLPKPRESRRDLRAHVRGKVPTAKPERGPAAGSEPGAAGRDMMKTV